MDFLPDYELDMKQGEEIANKIKSKMPCPIHKKKVRLDFDYDYNGANSYIIKYCCVEHAKTMAAALKKIELFNNVTIENHQPGT